MVYHCLSNIVRLFLRTILNFQAVPQRWHRCCGLNDLPVNGHDLIPNGFPYVILGNDGHVADVLYLDLL